jgi:hypothetical protein
MVARPSKGRSGADLDRLIDLSEVASEPSSDSIARENEIVEHIAHEDDFPEQTAEHSIDEQLEGLIDPDEIRGGTPTRPSPR